MLPGQVYKRLSSTEITDLSLIYEHEDEEAAKSGEKK